MSENYITECEFIVQGSPKTKSNHNLVNASGKKILPKNSAYALYEKEIVNSILDQVGEKQFKGKVICVIKTYFKFKDKHPDLNNMPKSICDGIEKSNIIKNDRDIVSVYLEEFYDSDNPRVEVGLYDYFHYRPSFNLIKRTDKEKASLEEELSSKKKNKTAKKTKKDIHCSLCGKETDLEHSKPIKSNTNKTKEYICFKCILTGC